jgi:RimJ/RimL family protein N-acetyltransferase
VAGDPIVLETDRLILRPWDHRDYEPMALIQGDARVRRYFPRTMTPAEVFADLDAAREKSRINGFHVQAAELKQTGELIGLIGLGVIPERTRAAIPSHPDVEIGWVLAERFWGRGLAVEGARAWLDHAARIGLTEIVAFTARLNLPSQRVMQKLGLTYRPGDDFEHPSVPVGSDLRPHVVYGVQLEP